MMLRVCINTHVYIYIIFQLQQLSVLSGDPSMAPVGIWPSKAPAPPLPRTAPSALPANALSRHHPGTLIFRQWRENFDGTPMVSQRDMTGNDIYI